MTATTQRNVLPTWPDWPMYSLITHLQLYRFRADLARARKEQPVAIELHEYLEGEIERLGCVLGCMCAEGIDFYEQALAAVQAQLSYDRPLVAHLSAGIERMQYYIRCQGT